MNIKMKFKVVTFLLGILLFPMIGCDKDEDKQYDLPRAEISLPTEGQVYYRGNTLFFSATFQSERGLKECTLYLKEDNQLKGWDDPWTPEQTIELSGNHMSVENEILFQPNIPFDIKSTDYVLVLLVVDLDLNYSTYQVPITID